MIVKLMTDEECDNFKSTDKAWAFRVRFDEAAGGATNLILLGPKYQVKKAAAGIQAAAAYALNHDGMADDQRAMNTSIPTPSGTADRDSFSPEPPPHDDE